MHRLKSQNDSVNAYTNWRRGVDKINSTIKIHWNTAKGPNHSVFLFGSVLRFANIRLLWRGVDSICGSVPIKKGKVDFIAYHSTSALGLRALANGKDPMTLTRALCRHRKTGLSLSDSTESDTIWKKFFAQRRLCINRTLGETWKNMAGVGGFKGRGRGFLSIPYLGTEPMTSS